MNNEKIKDWLTTLGVLNDDQKMSITNVIVFLFVGIVAFKLLFAGLDLSNKLFTWVVAPCDLNSMLPMLLGLMNYGHRRMITAQTQTVSVKTTEKETE